jgi:heavy metal translocating P-type ATPase
MAVMAFRPAEDQQATSILIESTVQQTTFEFAVRRALLPVALAGLLAGIVLYYGGAPQLAHWAWGAGALPVVISLAISIVQSLLAGRMGVDAVAVLSIAAALALGETLAAAVVAVMYAGGNALEDFAVKRAEHDLKSLIDRAPRIAHRKRDATIEDVPIEEVQIGDVVLVRGGEVIPVDGIIASGASGQVMLDESALTGEPLPVLRQIGERAFSGTINTGDTFELRTTATAGDSTYAGIVRMVTAAQTAKAPFIRLADRYALLLLPVTIIIAGLAWIMSGDAIRGLAVLVAATPCPLILAAPVAFISGISQAARRGILVKGGATLEALARTHTVMFDKTGTLTVGGARLLTVEVAPGENATEILRLAASLEQASHHAVAAAIVNAASLKNVTLSMPADVREAFGSGLQGNIDGKIVKIGSHGFVHGAGKPEDWIARALRRASWRSALSVFVAIDGRTVGALLLGDEVRRETPRAIQSLRAAGVRRIVMLTGDRADAAETIAAALDLDAVLADRVPADKVDAVASEQRHHPTLMVGDGINDAPALAAADVGIAMGSRGASASSEAASVVILVDRLDRVSEAVGIAKRTRAIAMQSIIIGMALSGVAMAFAAFGWLTPVAGALTQEAIDIAVILNALRALSPGYTLGRRAMSGSAASALSTEHQHLGPTLDRLRAIADDLDDADVPTALARISEARQIIAEKIVAHEREDERVIYPRVEKFLSDGHGLGAMSRGHREIMHLSRLFESLASDLKPDAVDRYLKRDAQRVIESIESLVRLHNAQEDDIYDRAAAQF